MGDSVSAASGGRGGKEGTGVGGGGAGSPKKGIVNRTAWGSGVANERDCALLAELEAADALMEAHHKVCSMVCGGVGLWGVG